MSLMGGGYRDVHVQAFVYGKCREGRGRGTGGRGKWAGCMGGGGSDKKRGEGMMESMHMIQNACGI